MRKLLSILVICAAIASPVAAQAHPDLSGKWSLDPKSIPAGTPAGFNVVITVKQDAKTINMDMVASMPMVSPVGRDTPREETSTPRTMLPPPITTATSTPSFFAAIRSSAMRSTVGWSIPKEWLPARYSPESLITTRR
jgi:hypothetical protein